MRIGLNFGLNLYEYGPDELITIAEKAEEFGFDSIWAGDHLILPETMPPRDSARPDFPVRKLDPSSSTVRLGFPPDTPLHDMFVTYAYMAAVTSRLSFGTYIFVLPLRHPMVTARAAGTLDVLSRGRLQLGIGLGWIPDEFELVGESYSSRARKTDECIRIIRALWSEEVTEFKGEFYSFGPARFEPKPFQGAGPPILIGGETESAMRRAARLGDGWCARVHTPESLSAASAKIQAMREESGRSDMPFEIVGMLQRNYDPTMIPALGEAGAGRLIVGMHGINELSVALEEMERAAESFI